MAGNVVGTWEGVQRGPSFDAIDAIDEIDAFDTFDTSDTSDTSDTEITRFTDAMAKAFDLALRRRERDFQPPTPEFDATDSQPRIDGSFAFARDAGTVQEALESESERPPSGQERVPFLCLALPLPLPPPCTSSTSSTSKAAAGADLRKIERERGTGVASGTDEGKVTATPLMAAPCDRQPVTGLSASALGDGVLARRNSEKPPVRIRESEQSKGSECVGAVPIVLSSLMQTPSDTACHQPSAGASTMAPTAVSTNVVPHAGALDHTELKPSAEVSDVSGTEIRYAFRTLDADRHVDVTLVRRTTAELPQITFYPSDGRVRQFLTERLPLAPSSWALTPDPAAVVAPAVFAMSAGQGIDDGPPQRDARQRHEDADDDD